MLICKPDALRASKKLHGLATALVATLLVLALLPAAARAQEPPAAETDAPPESVEPPDDQEPPAGEDETSEDEISGDETDATDEEGDGPADESTETDQTEEPPTDPPKIGDPVLIWPDPVNESQLGTDAIYYRYARSDGRSLLRTPTPDNPLRIWVGGDSMAGGASYGLTSLLGGNPNYEVVSDIRKSTGNVAGWFFDWPTHMNNVVAEAGYDVIVLSMGANDKQRFLNIDAEVGDPTWVELYNASVSALLNAAARPGRLVVYMGLPHMRPPWLHVLPDLVNPLFSNAAEATLSPGALYVDAASILTPDGVYVRRLAGEEHGNRNVRTGDGVHYTHYGGELVSVPIVEEIIRRQASEISEASEAE